MTSNKELNLFLLNNIDEITKQMREPTIKEQQSANNYYSKLIKSKKTDLNFYDLMDKENL